MQKEIESLVKDTLEKINCASSVEQIGRLKVETLGKNGSITAILKGMRQVDPAIKPAIGKLVNDARDTLERAFFATESRLHILEVNAELLRQKQDVTLVKSGHTVGSQHPLSIVQNKIIKFFVSIGFSVEFSPEIETEYYNFTALNVPKNHPARDMQDTFWIGEQILLRSQTSNGQIRTMERTEPPIKMLSPGRVYRADEVDATHSPCFHQIEGLVIDEKITMCDLKGVLELFVQDLFGSRTHIKFRPSFFPFTEPSVEVDASCFACCGDGCRICKGSGYIEILGAGMVNRRVLKNCKIESKYSGFAFGMGLERITNIIYGIQDMRLLFDNDIRFLKQF